MNKVHELDENLYYIHILMSSKKRPFANYELKVNRFLQIYELKVNT